MQGCREQGLFEIRKQGTKQNMPAWHERRAGKQPILLLGRVSWQQPGSCGANMTLVNKNIELKECVLSFPQDCNCYMIVTGRNR